MVWLTGDQQLSSRFAPPTDSEWEDISWTQASPAHPHVPGSGSGLGLGQLQQLLLNHALIALASCWKVEVLSGFKFHPEAWRFGARTEWYLGPVLLWSHDFSSSHRFFRGSQLCHHCVFSTPDYVFSTFFFLLLTVIHWQWDPSEALKARGCHQNSWSLFGIDQSPFKWWHVVLKMWH